jgi:hypothetical protein
LAIHSSPSFGWQAVLFALRASTFVPFTVLRWTGRLAGHIEEITKERAETANRHVYDLQFSFGIQPTIRKARYGTRLNANTNALKKAMPA